MRISDWSSDVCSSDLLDQYRALVAAGELRPDPDQAAAAERLDDLAVQMAAMTKRRGFVARLLGKGAPPPRGLYLWGSVGRGKGWEEHTSELQSLMRISYAVFCLTKKKETESQTITKKTTVRTYHTD